MTRFITNPIHLVYESGVITGIFSLSIKGGANLAGEKVEI